MPPRLAAIIVALATVAPAVRAQEPPTSGEVEAPEMPLLEGIPPEIAKLATDPTASMPTPTIDRKEDLSSRSPLFYALPVIGFWLILRRRSRGVRI